MKKIGLVIEGGGMRGVYSAGVLDRFLDEEIFFPYCIGVSAGSANMISFLAGQRGRSYRFYRTHTQNKQYMGVHTLVRKGSFFGLDYIYDTLSNNLDALDYEALEACGSEFRVVVTRSEDAETVYFGNADVADGDSRVLMASCAVPGVCRPITIDDVTYFDGGTTDPIPYKRALEEGCDALVVILSRRRGFVKRPENFRYLYGRLLQRYPEIVNALDVRHMVYNETLLGLEELEQEGRAVVIAPTRDVRMSMFSNDPEVLDEMYEAALEDADAAMEAVRGLFIGEERVG